MLVPQAPPGTPPLRVQLVASLADQATEKAWPAATVAGLNVMCGAGGGVPLSATISTGLLGTTRLPVLPGSSTARSVVLPVLLVVSAVEFHTAASAVKSAVPFVPSGAGAGVAGQDS